MRKSEPLMAPKQSQQVKQIDQLLEEEVPIRPRACLNSHGFLQDRFKKPIRIAPQHRSDLLPHFLSRYTDTVDDAA